MATHTRGTLLKRGDGGGTEVFTLVAAITSFSGPNITSPTVDVTTMDSTAREYITGLADNGEITFDAIFVGNNAQQQGLQSDQTAGTTRNFKLIFNDATLEANRTTFSFAAVVTGFVFNGQVDDAWRVSITLKLSGAITKVYAT